MRYTSIVGLSAERRIPRVGKIRLGQKVVTTRGDGSTYERPVALDHFVVPPEVAKVFGETPSSLDVMFPVDDLGVIFPVAYKYYKRELLFCTGNGKVAARVVEGSKEYQEIECPCPFLEAKNACRHAGSLMFLLPRVSIGGVYQMDTPSRNNIIAIQSGIEHARGLLGRVAWVPFKLTLTPRRMTVEGALKTVHLVNLLLASFEQIEASRLQLQSLRSLVAPSEAESVALIAAPEDSPDDLEEPAEPVETAGNVESGPEAPRQMGAGELAALEGKARRLAGQLKKAAKATELAIKTALGRKTLHLLVAELERQAAGGHGDPIVWADDKASPAGSPGEGPGELEALVLGLGDLGEALGMKPAEIAARVKSVQSGGPEMVCKLHADWTAQVAQKGKS